MNIDKQALRERYSPKPVPKCHICGEEMTIQRISASRITYGCTGATYDDKGCHYAEGRSIADDHYEQSRVTVVDVIDPDVLALLDELEAETGYREGAFVACNRWHDKFRETEDKLECAERRIAELEARTVVVKQFDDFQIVHYGATEDYAKGYIDCQSNYNKAIYAAGIKVKGGDGWMVVACSSVKGTKGTRGGFCVASLSTNRRLLVGGWWQVHPARKGATK